VSQHNDNLFAPFAKFGKTMLDQAAADPTALMIRQNGHRRQRYCRYGILRCFDGHSAEQDMANDLAVKFGDKRKQDGAFRSQPVDQVCFVGALKGSLV
jgi:hypothetical protein